MTEKKSRWTLGDDPHLYESGSRADEVGMSLPEKFEHRLGLARRTLAQIVRKYADDYALALLRSPHRMDRMNGIIRAHLLAYGIRPEDIENVRQELVSEPPSTPAPNVQDEVADTLIDFEL